jgi:ClpP class serine protease
MKQLPRIAGRLYCEPWAILPSHHAEICSQFRRALEGGADIEAKLPREAASPVDPRGAADDAVGPCYQADDGRARFWHPPVEVRGSLAIMRVSGVIGKHLSTLEMWCGGCDSALVKKQAENIAADERIENVLIIFDTPGGNCVGGVETALAIEAMGKAGKSTVAFTETQCASNGYFWAAACDRIVASPSALIGSISTYCAFLDKSRAYEMEGLEVKMFRTGEVKGAGTPGKPWTEAEMNFYQELTDQFGEQFKGFVERRRGISRDLMEGQYWPGEFAPAGIVDAIELDVEALISAIIS